jgi:hypothetical protein
LSHIWLIFAIFSAKNFTSWSYFRPLPSWSYLFISSSSVFS